MLLLTAALVLSLPQGQVAPQASPVPPRDVALDLAPLAARHDVPALGAAAIEGNRITALGVTGVLQRGLEVDVEPEDPWHLGSCTKSMTATLVALAVEDGELDFETTLGDVFACGEGGRELHADWEDVTVAQLLRHRAGAPHDLTRYGALGLAVWGAKDDPVKQRRLLVDGLLRRAPEGEPGVGYVYSNNGYVLAGAMLEELWGKSYEDSLRERLFEPLGMASAGFGPPRPMGEVPVGHDFDGEPVGTDASADNPAAYGPAGTVHANLADWCRFAMLHLAGARGESTWLSEELFAQLHAPHPETQESYAMGWLVYARPWAGALVEGGRGRRENGRVLYHNGTNLRWTSVLWIAPDANRAYLAVTNRGGTEGGRACDAAVTRLILDDAARDRAAMRPGARGR